MKIIQINVTGWMERVYIVTEKESLKILRDIKKMHNMLCQSTKPPLRINIKEVCKLGLQPTNKEIIIYT